uniref:Uncharacterized protein n=1 Tax=Rhizophora mucronata TaxID=61149 RepID=A0A2P2P9T6_RHIMU
MAIWVGSLGCFMPHTTPRTIISSTLTYLLRKLNVTDWLSLSKRCPSLRLLRM